MRGVQSDTATIPRYNDTSVFHHFAEFSTKVAMRGGIICAPPQVYFL